MIERACFVNSFAVASCSTCALTNDLSYVTEKQNFLERLSLETERIFNVRPELFTFVYIHMRGCQPPTSIDGEWVIDDVIMEATWRHFWGKKRREKDVVLIVTFDLIGLLPTNHIIAYITMAYQSL